jgi:hypothetical protein
MHFHIHHARNRPVTLFDGFRKSPDSMPNWAIWFLREKTEIQAANEALRVNVV